MVVIITAGDSAELKSLAAKIQQINVLDTLTKSVKYVNNKTNEIILTVEFNSCTLGNDCIGDCECGTVDASGKKISTCPREKQCEKYSRKIWERKRREALRYPDKYPKNSPYISR